jgi:hypothetical protein
VHRHRASSWLTKSQKDLGEYNQCQSMLRQLYELGIKGHPQEFLSYRIIYLLHTRNRSGKSTRLSYPSLR